MVRFALDCFGQSCADHCRLSNVSSLSGLTESDVARTRNGTFIATKTRILQRFIERESFERIHIITSKFRRRFVRYSGIGAATFVLL